MKIIKKILSLLFFGTIGGLLGSLGGTDGVSKGVRRIGIPAILTIFAIFALHNFWCISIMFMSFALSLGYGIPSISDSGSRLGRFWESIFHYHVLLKTKEDRKLMILTNIFTRGTIGCLICLSMLCVPLTKGNSLLYGIFTVIIVITWSFISWRSLGTFKFRGKELLWSEFIIYSILVGLSQLLIKL